MVTQRDEFCDQRRMLGFGLVKNLVGGILDCGRRDKDLPKPLAFFSMLLMVRSMAVKSIG
jgi:hypothetical protein